ncbi:MAG TPA: CPBP family intramembrane glutamic endopeptidase [Acidimicrobiales bacterium]
MTESEGERTTAATTWWPLVVAVGLLTVSNVVANELLPSPLYVPWNLTMAAALLAVARHDGCSRIELGLHRAQLRRGVRWGAVLYVGVLVIYVVAAFLPPTRDLFRDERVGDVPFWGMAYQVVLRIPLGTVLLEEVAFRGVVPALTARRTTLGRAIVFSSALFGLWHILPALGIAGVNPAFEDLFGSGLGSVVAVVGAVLATFVAGLFMTWVRYRSDSLLAPVLLHTATNSLGYLVAWSVFHFDW